MTIVYVNKKGVVKYSPLRFNIKKLSFPSIYNDGFDKHVYSIAPDEDYFVLGCTIPENPINPQSPDNYMNSALRHVMTPLEKFFMYANYCPISLLQETDFRSAGSSFDIISTPYITTMFQDTSNEYQ